MSKLVFILFLIIGSISCKDDCNDNEPNLNAAYDQVDITRQEHYADPTNTAKCKAYVAALENCIKQMEGCVDFDQVESYRNTLDAAREECK